MSKQVLDNGLVAHATPMEGKKLSVLRIGINVGSKNETTEKRGISHLLEHMMFRSNEYRSHDKLAEEFEYNGVDVNAHTSRSNTILQFSAPPEKLDAMLMLASQAISCQNYDKNEFHTEKSGPVTTELVNMERQPFGRFINRFANPSIFEGTPYGESVIGTIESVNGLTLDDLIDFKSKFYVPNNMVVSVSGCVDEASYFEAVKKYFGNLQNKDVTQPIFSWNFKPNSKVTEFSDLKDPKNAKQDQAFIFFVYKAPSKNDAKSIPTSMLSNIISNGFTSLLFKELRAKRGLGYSPAGGYECIEDMGTCYMGLPGVHPSRLNEVANYFNEMTNNLKLNQVEEDHFEGKRFHILSSILKSFDSSESMAMRPIYQEFERPMYTPSEVVDKIRTVNREQVQEVAKEIFSQKPMILVAVPPGYNVNL